ncbi:hypothetical protein PINS_up005590 [Pythium insidiosum]|nr:hypothetical protein PINS_up005590 [Pythium insidiosum]
MTDGAGIDHDASAAVDRSLPSALERFVDRHRHQQQRSPSQATDDSGSDASREEEELLLLNASDTVVSPLELASLVGFLSLVNTRLVRLSLSRSNVGPNGASLLGRALATNNSLQFLELERCELIGNPYRASFDGLRALAKGLESARSDLRFLSIVLWLVSVAGNALQPNGCRIVLNALTVHRRLTALDLSDTLLTLFNDEQGVLALTYVLRHAKQLCWLALDGNELTQRLAQRLQQSLDASATITSLHAERCGAFRLQLKGVHDETKTGAN